MATNEEFYANLKPFNQFQGIFDLSHYTQLPDDWLVVISDIEGSTLAIQQGKYREVNAVGVASMVAVFNALKPLAIPFVFGGDGATLCIPHRAVEQVKKALLGTQIMAKESFSLDLRCGIVPYSDIQQAQQQVLVGKCQVSNGYYQAAFTGKGLSYAEKLVKNDPAGLYIFNDSTVSADVDFTGFECRWKDIPSPHEETVSLLVLSTAGNTEENNKVYQQVFSQIQQIYGSADDYRPVQQTGLELTSNVQNLQDEIKIRTSSKSKWARLLYCLFLPWKVRLGHYWMKNNKKALDTDWGEYKASLISNTDFQKFDENLRMIISGNKQQRAELNLYLEKQHQIKQLVYGMHVSDRALMTCVISDYNSNHIHFIDGANGGYTLAAKALKKQLKDIKIHDN